MRAVLFLLCLALAPVQRPTDIVRWTVTAPGPWTRAGETLELTVKASIEDGWKLYAIEQPTTGPLPLAFAAPKPFAVLTRKLVAPPAKTLDDPLFEGSTKYYEKQVAIKVPVSVPNDLAGIHEIPLEVTFQACGADICLRPYTQKLPVRIEVRR